VPHPAHGLRPDQRRVAENDQEIIGSPRDGGFRGIVELTL